MIICFQTFSRTQLKLIGITASNTWGLLLLVFLMGYGLVEVPRTVWHASNLEYQLAHVYFKVSKMSTEKEEAEEKLHEVLTVRGYLHSAIVETQVRNYCITSVMLCTLLWSLLK